MYSFRVLKNRYKMKAFKRNQRMCLAMKFCIICILHMHELKNAFAMQNRAF